MSQNPKDFQANQVRVSQIIASKKIDGSNESSKLKLAIYDSDVSNNFSGGIDQSDLNLSTIDESVWLLVDNSTDIGKVLFTGDVEIKGNLLSNSQSSTLGSTVTGDLFVTDDLGVANNVGIGLGTGVLDGSQITGLTSKLLVKAV